MKTANGEENAMGGLIGWAAYIWLIVSEAIEEWSYLAIGDSLRRFTYTAEPRQQYQQKIEQSIRSRQTTPAKVADTV